MVAPQCARQCGRVGALMATIARAIGLGFLTVSFGAHPVFAAGDVAVDHLVAAHSKRVNFEQESASPEARHVADWVLDSGDNLGMPFVLIDKANAKVFVFHADGRLRGAAPALLGLAVGDDSVPGIGQRKLSSILPDERTTPAGRFVAALDRNLHGGPILWVDYEAAISLHPVITSNAQERRAQRLATPTPLDNRVSYGCINVPVEFFKKVVSAAFTGTNGVVYVLPETRSAQQVFASYDVDERAQLRAAAQQDVPAPTDVQSNAKLAGQ